MEPFKNQISTQLKLKKKRILHLTKKVYRLQKKLHPQKKTGKSQARPLKRMVVRKQLKNEAKTVNPKKRPKEKKPSQKKMRVKAKKRMEKRKKMMEK